MQVLCRGYAGAGYMRENTVNSTTVLGFEGNVYVHILKQKALDFFYIL